MYTLSQLITRIHNNVHAYDDSALASLQILQDSCVKDIAFDDFCLDSRQLQANNAFVLVKSAVNHEDSKSITYAQKADGHCALIISQIDLSTANISTPWVLAENIPAILGSLQCELLQLQQPCTLPKIMAVTGTNGKTSIATLTAQLIDGYYTSHVSTNSDNKKVALMGTAGQGIYPDLEPSSHTTKDVLSVHKSLHAFAKQNVDALCLEASSHGLHQKRLQAMPISVATYSNLSHDHLDYHITMDEYAQAKALLFNKKEFPSLQHAVINLDDDYAFIMQEHAQTTGVQVWSYSLHDSDATFFVEDFHAHSHGVDIVLRTPFGVLNLQSPLLGAFNVSNFVAAIASSIALGVEFAAIAELVKTLAGVRGRMEGCLANADKNHARCIVDYAHTPDAITQVIDGLRMHTQGSSGKLHIVFGCGGNRDKTKRPRMLEAALAADSVIVTADNPRFEEPEDIINDMLTIINDQNKHKVQVVIDRTEAIAQALKQANPQDMVVIAGKGHETYQEIKGVRYDFDDMAVLTQLLQA